MTKRLIETLWQDEAGITSIEYAFMATLIAVTCVVMVTATGVNLNNLYTRVCSDVAQATAGADCD